MQFHLNGYEPGDPEIADTSRRAVEQGMAGSVPDRVDVLIVGCGPAGLTLAAQLAAFGNIKTAVIEQKASPLLRGQADGVACRSMEVFAAFGFAERLLKEAYWVNETSFWKPDAAAPGNIIRTGRIQDVEEGLSEFPHVILNQARVHDFLLDVMQKSSAGLRPYYNRQLLELTVGRGATPRTHPVEVKLHRTDRDEVETVKARFVVGCDGARSTVRRILGRELRGDSANQAWGVMDVLAVTDFPDFRLKALIQSAGGGSIVLIPREGGYLVRIYVEMSKLAADERVGNRDIVVEDLIAAAQRIFHPYRLEVKEIAWWSVYEIGQRLTDHFDDASSDQDPADPPRVFIAGDACHTHSPKAGQGMNVSIQDGFNLGWKLAGVLGGLYKPELLHSYSAERQAVAKELIDFDRRWTTLLAAPHRSPETPHGVDPEEVQRFFEQHGRYTAGTATRYVPSTLTSNGEHQNLATGFQIGTRFHSASVIRLADAKEIHLGHTIKADGRWRLFIFAGPEDPMDAASPIARLVSYLATDPSSPIVSYTPKDADVDAIIDVRAVFQQDHRSLAVSMAPSLLLPSKGRLGLRDYEKMFCALQNEPEDIYLLRGVDRARGCIIVVRPDQYVADVLPLDARAALTARFANFMVPARPSDSD